MFAEHPKIKSVQEQKDLSDYIVRMYSIFIYIDSICNRYPDCGLVILGDFNKLDISNITSDLDLRQVVDCIPGVVTS